MKEWETVLKHLTSYAIYEKLNYANDVEKNCNDCTQIEHVDRIYNGIHNLCCQLERNLKNLSAVFDQGYNETEQCQYLNLWFYSEVWKRFSSFRKKIYDTGIISRLTYVWGNIYDTLSNVRCNYIWHNKINFDVLKELISLFYFFKNYDIIEKSVLSDNNRCQTYYEYVKENEDLYKKHKDKFCKHPYTTWLNYCNTHKKYDPSKLLSKITCNDQISRNMEQSEPAIAHVEPEVGTSPTIPSNIVSSVTAVSTMSVIFLILFLFYKFTPFGSLLKGLIRRGKITEENIDEEIGYTFLNNSETQSLNFDGSKYNIAYNSL
ncbi:PIR Superfamily Protein [Plasmodium ovale wallikeri]|uniref:PIR Superfamily Protein n=1 Tax=Plasmodium ovale wallikeri TaxID=864142 RepID=A0A1A9ATT9_PLAOA|nr:PIR Superfamily Protein [Plasmodium ovale wallikeri]SBT59542.1 PIR Superfamily Protein [Plasmodium ovale wallikeri]